MTSSTSPTSPFFAGGAITNSQFFVGRREAIDFIMTRMAGTQPTSVNIVGKPRMGKSSLLHHICQTYEAGVQRYNRDPQAFVVVYLSLQEVQCRRETSFYEAIAERLLKRFQVCDNAALADPLKSRPLDRAAFSTAMDRWKAVNVLPVLCLDMFEELFQNPTEFDNDFFDNLRSLMDRGALMLIISSYKPLITYSRQHRLTSEFFNLGNVMPLNDLAEREAQDLVKLPETTQPGTGIALKDERQQLALEWGKRHPFHLQLACNALWTAKQNDRDNKWAKQEFERQIGRKVRSHTPLAWVEAIGRLARMSGKQATSVSDTITGVAIVLVIVFASIGVIKWDVISQWILQKFLGK